MLQQSLCWPFITVIDRLEDCYSLTCPHNVSASRDCQQRQTSLYSRCVQDLSQKSACRLKMWRLVVWACLYTDSACDSIPSMIGFQNLPTTVHEHCGPALLFCRNIKSSPSRFKCKHIWEIQRTAAIAIVALVPSKLHACCYPELWTHINMTSYQYASAYSKLLNVQHSHLFTWAVETKQNIQLQKSIHCAHPVQQIDNLTISINPAVVAADPVAQISAAAWLCQRTAPVAASCCWPPRVS